MRYELKARSIGEILDGAFVLYRNHFVDLFKVALLVHGVSLVVRLIVTYAMTGTLGEQAAMLAHPKDMERVGYVTLPLGLLVWVFQDAALVKSAGDLLLGKPVAPWEGVQKRFNAVLMADCLTLLGILLGFILLVVPGILLSIRWALTTQAVMLEDKGALGSLARSRRLVEGRRGKVFMLTSIWWSVWMGLLIGIMALEPDALKALPVLGDLVGVLTAAVVAPLGPCVMTLLYYDLRVDKEALDLELLANAPRAAAAPATAP